MQQTRNRKSRRSNGIERRIYRLQRRRWTVRRARFCMEVDGSRARRAIAESYAGNTAAGWIARRLISATPVGTRLRSSEAPPESLTAHQAPREPVIAHRVRRKEHHRRRSGDLVRQQAAECELPGYRIGEPDDLDADATRRRKERC